ncbi:MAG: PfkB family carbohydrate kinase [Victivallales bacterium]|jgi:sugar/nucleoside kinase (ribokinase family)
MNHTRPIDAVVAGYLGVDIAPGFANREAVSFTELFRPGRLIETTGLHFSLGGVVANTGLAMRKFEQNVALMGCIGNDALGDLALAQFADAGIKGGIKRKDSTGTAYGIVIAAPGADRIFLEDPGCNRIFSADDIDYDLVTQSRLFHFGYPPLMDALWKNEGVKLKELLERVRACGTVVSLDMTLPDPDAPSGKADWMTILSSILPLVDIFVPSIEELVFMLDPILYYRAMKQGAGGDMIDAIPEEEYGRIAEKVIGMGVKVLLLKAGRKGAYLRTGDMTKLITSSLSLSDRIGCPHGNWIPSLPVDAGRFRNASGAGDCAIAGFLTALLKNETVLTAGQYAMMAGRDNLYGADAVSGLREWNEMSK